MGSEPREDLQDRAAEHERAQRVRDLLARMTRDYQGKQIGGRYILHECIGAGGMGLVFLGQQLALNRPVVIKLLREGVVLDERNHQRFEREAIGLSRLDHPNIVTLYDFGYDDQRAYIVMEHVDGEMLKDRMQGQRRLGYDLVVHIAVQLLGAVAHAHDQHIAHRDLKPSNVMLCVRQGREDVVKVLDFGLAKLMDDDEDLTQGEIIGSTPYLAPERITGGRGDERSDIYAIGVMLYEMICGQLPFEADSDLELLAKHVREEPRPLSLQLPLDHEYPEEVLELVHRFLAKDPDERPDNASQALELLVEQVVNREAFSDAARERLQLIFGMDVSQTMSSSDLMLHLHDSSPEIRVGFLRRRQPATSPSHTALPVLRAHDGGVSYGQGPTPPQMLGAPIVDGSHTDEYLALRLEEHQREKTAPISAPPGRFTQPAFIGGVVGGALLAVVLVAAVLMASRSEERAERAVSDASFLASAATQTAHERAKEAFDAFPGTVVLDVKPSGARVSIDGKAVEGSRVELPPGKHMLRVRKRGWRTRKVSVEVEPGVKVGVAVSLRRIKRRARKRPGRRRSEPRDAQIEEEEEEIQEVRSSSKAPGEVDLLQPDELRPEVQDGGDELLSVQ